jgi:hypothetical protein
MFLFPPGLFSPPVMAIAQRPDHDLTVIFDRGDVGFWRDADGNVWVRLGPPDLPLAAFEVPAHALEYLARPDISALVTIGAAAALAGATQ